MPSYKFFLHPFVEIFLDMGSLNTFLKGITSPTIKLFSGIFSCLVSIAFIKLDVANISTSITPDVDTSKITTSVN